MEGFVRVRWGASWEGLAVGLVRGLWRVWTQLAQGLVTCGTPWLGQHLRERDAISSHKFLLLLLFPFIRTLRSESLSWCSTNIIFLKLNLLMIVLSNIVRLLRSAPLFQIFNLLHLICIYVISDNQRSEIVKHSHLLLCWKVNIDNALWRCRNKLWLVKWLVLFMLYWAKYYLALFDLIACIKYINSSLLSLGFDSFIVLKLPINDTLFRVCSLDNSIFLIFSSVHFLS